MQCHDEPPSAATATVHPTGQFLDPRALQQAACTGATGRDPREGRDSRDGRRARAREETEALLRQADDILPEQDADEEDVLVGGEDDDEAVARLLAARKLRLPTVERVRVYGNRMVLEPVVPVVPRATSASSRTTGSRTCGLFTFWRRFK